MNPAHIELERLIYQAISETADGTAIDAAHATRAVVSLFTQVEDYWTEVDTTSVGDLPGRTSIRTRSLVCAVPRESIPFREEPNRRYGLETPDAG